MYEISHRNCFWTKMWKDIPLSFLMTGFEVYMHFVILYIWSTGPEWQNAFSPQRQSFCSIFQLFKLGKIIICISSTRMVDWLRKCQPSTKSFNNCDLKHVSLWYYSIIYLSEIQQVSVDSIKFLTNISFGKHTFRVLFGTNLNISFENEISTTCILVNKYRLNVISEWLWAKRIRGFFFNILQL